MISVGSNFFFTVTLPCTLWFFDRGKSALPPSPPAPLPKGEGSKTGKSAANSKGSSPSGRGGGEVLAEYDYSNHVGARYRDTVLFIDARHIFRQLDRAHRAIVPTNLAPRQGCQPSAHALHPYQPALSSHLRDKTSRTDSRREWRHELHSYLGGVVNGLDAIQKESAVWRIMSIFSSP